MHTHLSYAPPIYNHSRLVFKIEKLIKRAESKLKLSVNFHYDSDIINHFFVSMAGPYVSIGNTGYYINKCSYEKLSLVEWEDYIVNQLIDIIRFVTHLFTSKSSNKRARNRNKIVHGVIPDRERQFTDLTQFYRAGIER